MTGCEDADFTKLSAYFSAQLAKAAETYESLVDLDKKLKAAIETGEGNGRDSTADRGG